MTGNTPAQQDCELEPSVNNAAPVEIDFGGPDDLLKLTRMDDLQMRKVDRAIKASRQIVKNKLAIVLIFAFVVSMPVVLVVLVWAGDKEIRDQLVQVYTHWLTILASLAGAAIGFNAAAANQ